MVKFEPETNDMKIKDLFVVDQLLTGRTEIETTSKLNVGLIWSCPGSNFKPTTGTVTAYEYPDGSINPSGTLGLIAPIFLPNGATITACILYGADTAETWTLRRSLLSDGTSINDLATGNHNTEDTSITNALVDNSTYCYWITTSILEVGDEVDGARITYTL